LRIQAQASDKTWGPVFPLPRNYSRLWYGRGCSPLLIRRVCTCNETGKYERTFTVVPGCTRCYWSCPRKFAKLTFRRHHFHLRAALQIKKFTSLFPFLPPPPHSPHSFATSLHALSKHRTPTCRHSIATHSLSLSLPCVSFALSLLLLLRVCCSRDRYVVLSLGSCFAVSSQGF
jgi:hypothetical protein